MARAWSQVLHPGWRLAALGLAWPAGLWLQLQQPQLWPVAVYQGLCLLVLLLMPVGWLVARAARVRWPGRAWRTAGMVLVALALLGTLAFASTGWRASLRLAERLPAALEGVDLWVTGVVDELPMRHASGTRFVFKVETAQTSADGVPVLLPPLLALSWYAGLDQSDWMDLPVPALRAGQRWRLPLRLKQVHGLLNPDGFDSELWWFEQGVGAQGAVRQARGAPPATLLGPAWGYPVARMREHLREALARHVPDARQSGVLAALVVGDQAAIVRADWDLFRQTGVAHLVSISGVHVTMFAWLAAGLLGRLWRLWPAGMRWVPTPTAARWGGVLLAAAYAALAGWGVPAQRTVLMLAVAALLRGAALNWPWPVVLLLAALVVTALDPWALLQAGFWLSFVAVGLLMASEPASRAAAAAGWRAQLLAHGRSQLVASWGLAPLSLLFFQQLSLVGLLANLVAIPLVTLLVTPLALLGVLLPPLWTLAAGLVQAMVAGLSVLASWPQAVWFAAAAPGWALACGLAAALLAVLPLPWALRWLALPLALPMLAPAPQRPAAGRFALVVVDVGQGTAVLVQTRQHLMVYDSGPSYGPDSDAGQRVLLPLMHARGAQQIHRLMLSHRDTDHVGGAAALMAALPVGLLHSGLPDDHPLHAAGVPVLPCVAGQRWQWDGVQFQVLHPSADDRQLATRPNAQSCVVQVQDALGRRALLTGDIEAAQEAALLQRHGAALASTVLLVPHHGSRTSSTPAFIDAVQPDVAVVQAGYRSRYGHPASDVVARYNARNIKLVRSDQCGAWLWHDGDSHCTRELRQRYWHWSPPAGGAEVASQRWSGTSSP